MPFELVLENLPALNHLIPLMQLPLKLLFKHEGLQPDLLTHPFLALWGTQFFAFFLVTGALFLKLESQIEAVLLLMVLL